jgi:hypothetical protein
MFEGHDIYKINRNWIFDLTTFRGYKIRTKKEKIIECTEAFRLKNIGKPGELEFTRVIESVPLGVLRKSEDIVREYYKEALVNED